MEKNIKHKLYTNKDLNAPASIKDEHGDIVLALCKVCGKGEADLSEPCLSFFQSWDRVIKNINLR